MNKNDYTGLYKGIIMLRKGRENDEDVWFATVGRQIITDRVYKTKEELIECLESLNLETICKIISGAIGRVIELTTNNKKQ